MSELKILLLHSDKGVLKVTKDLLRRIGYPESAIVATVNPVKGINAIKNSNVCLVFCGSRFPIFQDSEVYTVINTLKERNNFVLIAYSGGGEKYVYLQSGADFYLAQPSSYDDLKSTIIKACKSREISFLKLAERFTAIALPAKELDE